MSNSIVERARAIAHEAHSTQVRKISGAPFIEHPESVARIVEHYGGSDAAIAAALLHDVLEDTDWSVEDLIKEVGADVVRLVEVVTEDTHLPRDERKRRYIAAVVGGPFEAKLISCADKIHNFSSMIDAYASEGSALWDHFAGGKEAHDAFADALLSALKKEWHHPIIDELEAVVTRLRELE